MAYQLPAVDSRMVFDLCKEVQAGFRTPDAVPLAEDIDERIASALNVPPAPYANSLEAAFALRDIIFPQIDYLNVDFREYFYADRGGMSYICDVKHHHGEGCGHGSTRARALVAALLTHICYGLDDA